MIIRTRGGDMEYRTELGTLLGQYGLGRAGYGASAGVPVTTLTVAGIPAVHAAITFAAEAVAILPMRVWRGEEPIPQRVGTTWQARLFRGSPNEQQKSWYHFWEAVQSSLDYRGNAYIWKSKDKSGRVVRMYALHPDQVYLRRETTTKRILYRVAFGGAYPTPPEVSQYAAVTVGEETILHIRGRGGSGELVSPSPITLFRSALAVAVAKQQYEANLYKQGVQGGLVVSFPGGTTVEQANRWRENFDADHAGTTNAGKTKVVGGGATVTQIGMTQKDAQFVDSIALSVNDVSRIFRIPAWFLGVDYKHDHPATPEHEQQRWAQHGLNPRLARIEAALYADPDLFGASQDYPAFDTQNLIRGDLATEADIAIRKVQAGIWLPDDARALDGLPPYPDGIGQIPQITPVGGAPNPNS